MQRLRYLDFDLRIDRVAPGEYEARVLRSPTGEGSTTFALPFTEERLELLILKVGQRRSRTRRPASNEIAAGREIGETLFNSVFAGTVRDCLRASLDAANAREATGLRIRLRLQDAPELADVPWEFLYDPSSDLFFAQSNYTPVVRYVEMPEPVRPLRVSLPLRVLAIAPSPADVAELDTARELALLRNALEPLRVQGKVEVHEVLPATLGTLQRELRRRAHHIFHFIGHGHFEQAAGQGFLVLEDERKRGVSVDADRIGALLHDHRSLRLAILNACEGARNSRTDPFASVATTVVRRGVPAVAAMQFEISDEAAVSFAAEFYAALADGYPVDAAVAEARKAIYAQATFNDVEWATPVLYSRADDGAIFDIEPRPATQPGTARVPQSVASPAPPPAPSRPTPAEPLASLGSAPARSAPGASGSTTGEAQPDGPRAAAGGGAGRWRLAAIVSAAAIVVLFVAVSILRHRPAEPSFTEAVEMVPVSPEGEPAPPIEVVPPQENEPAPANPPLSSEPPPTETSVPEQPEGGPPTEGGVLHPSRGVVNAEILRVSPSLLALFLPDLVVDDIRVSADLPNRRLIVTALVRNVGRATAATTTARLRGPNLADYVTQVPELPAGGKEAVSFFTPWGVERDLEVVVDADDAVRELDESNNARRRTVERPLRPPQDR